MTFLPPPVEQKGAWLTVDLLKHITEATGTKPEYFGLGFIQLKIDKKARVHFYSKELNPLLDDEEVHNHRYNFESTVLKGALINEVFYWKEVAESDWELAEVSCTPNDSREPRVILPSVEAVHLCTFETSANQKYSVTDNMFHRVKWDSDVVTLLNRGPILEEFAKVIRNKKKPYVCPFSAPLGEAKCWEIIEKILTL